MATVKKKTLQNGDVRWTTQVYKKGYKRHYICKRTQAAAEREARKVILAMEENTWDEFAINEQKSGNTNLKYFLKKYLNEITPHKKGGAKTITNETSVLNLIIRSPLSKMDVYRIQSGHIIQLAYKWRDSGNKSATILRKLTTLSDVFGTMKSTWNHKNLENPVHEAKVTLRNKLDLDDTERHRTLTKNELSNILDALDACKSPYIRWVFELALETAARRRELLENTWNNLSINKDWLHIPKALSKTRTKRDIPLTPKATLIFKAIEAYQSPQEQCNDENLIPITEKSFEEAWKKAIKRSKVKNFQFRDTRHIATTMLSDIFPKMQDLAKITGHKKLETLMIYYEKDINDRVQVMKDFHTIPNDSIK